MEHYYDSDPEIQKSEETVQYWKTVIDSFEREVYENIIHR